MAFHFSLGDQVAIDALKAENNIKIIVLDAIKAIKNQQEKRSE